MNGCDFSRDSGIAHENGPAEVAGKSLLETAAGGLALDEMIKLEVSAARVPV